MIMGEDLATVHAYLCADGYVIKNPPTQKQKYYMLGLRNTNLFLLKDFQERFEKVFKIKPHLIEGQRCRIGSKEIYEKLTNQFGSFYSWKWTMPPMDANLLRFWLRAYFDCEGWVTCKTHQNRMIGADCVNERGIKQIQNALKILEIESKLKKRNTKNIFSLSIYGKDNLIRFHKKVGFLHPKKKEKLDKVINDFMNYEWNFDSTEDILRAKAKIKRQNGVLIIISKLENNLLTLQKELLKMHKFTIKVHKRKNGIGTIYYELNINKKEEIKYLINNNLLDEEEKQKWLKLQK